YTLVFRKFLNRPKEYSRIFFFVQLYTRVLKIRRMHLCLVIIAKQTLHKSKTLFPLFSSLQVQRFGNGNPVKPGGELRISFKRADRLVNLYKHFLGNIFRVGWYLHDTQGGV